MRFWIREFTGWLLLALGLFIFYVCLLLLLDQPPKLLPSGPLTLIGIIVFRGGIHLLKVAVAARVCLQAQAEISEQRGGPGRRETQRKP
jgi:hypothetical protein